MKKSMVIRLNYHDFNKIMRSCAKFANSKFAKKSPGANMMTKIELSSDGKKVTAVALDSYKLLKISVPAMKNSDEGKIIIPAIKAVGKDAKVVEIISDENDVTVKCATSMTVYEKFDGDFFNHTNIFPVNDPDFVCIYNPKNLIDALSTFTDLDTVKIELFQNSQMVISSPNQKSLVLGCRRS